MSDKHPSPEKAPLDGIVPTNPARPFAKSPARRLIYLELVLKHMWNTAAVGNSERIADCLAESLGIVEISETEFAFDHADRIG